MARLIKVCWIGKYYYYYFKSYRRKASKMNSILSLTIGSILSIKKKKKSPSRDQVLKHSKYVYSEFSEKDSGPDLSYQVKNNAETLGGSRPRLGPPPSQKIQGRLPYKGRWTNKNIALCKLTHPHNFCASALNIIQRTTVLLLPKTRLKKLILERNNQGHGQYPLLCLFSAHKPTEKQDT